MDKTNHKSGKKLGLWIATALVIGNMVGSGIFLLPSSLAAYGGISIIGWLYTSMGAILLALVFSRLSKMVPGSGGPYTFTRVSFGNFPAFLVAWGYWISIWTGNAAITISMIGYLSSLFPILKSSSFLQILTGLSAIWIITIINISGVRNAGYIQVITTILKLTPILLLAFIGIFYFNQDHFIPFNLSSKTSFSAITATAGLTLWAFLGVESASIPANHIINPKKTIPRATILGTTFTAFIYILSTVAVLGILSPVFLKVSTAPFADAATKIWGNWAGNFIAAGAAISCLGALNGWIMLQGQMPKAIADDGLFPKVFSKLSKKNTPFMGLIISSILISLLILMNFSKGLVEQFTFIIMLATLVCIIPYILCSLSEIIIYFKNPKKFKKWILVRSVILAFLALCYSVWAAIGLGITIILWGLALLAAGIPFFLYSRKYRK